MSAAVELVQSVVVPQGGFIHMAIGVALAAAIGAVVYLGTLIGLWIMGGQPKGPETNVLDLARQVSQALHR